jgi:outer membrane protein OmpA-like peptidoglycan-associated protein/Tol biopolymer transport system component
MSILNANILIIPNHKLKIKINYLELFYMKNSIFKLIVFTILFSTQNFLFSQNYTTKKTATGKAKEAYDEGLAANITKDTEKALKAFTNAVKTDPTFIDAQIQQAAILYKLNRLPEAEEAFEKVVKIDPNYEPEALFSLGNIELKQEKYLEAASHYEVYVKSGKASPDKKNRAEISARNVRFKDAAMKNPVPFNPQSLGNKINTPQYSEYLPTLTADGQTLIYTARVGNQEDFYISKKINDEWQKGEPMTDLNTDENEGAQCISTDGRNLFYTVCNRTGVMGTCDVFFSQKKGGKWSIAKNFPSINTNAWESQPSMSADGRKIYFSSDRPGGLGGRDIWYVTYENGLWGDAKNVGKPINTPADEQTPFIHPDGVTMYFTSAGHPGMGGTDIYMSRLEDSAWVNPINLGYPINTKEDEGTLSVSLDGKIAFYARNVNTGATAKANYDLFSFELPENVRAYPVTYVRATVSDSETKQPIVDSRLEFIDLSTQKPVIVSFTDETGEFLACLPYGKNYSLNVSKPGYIFHSENFNLLEIDPLHKPVILSIQMQHIPLPVVAEVKPVEATPAPVMEKSKAIVLKNVFFDTDKADLRSESFAELNKLALLLNENPTVRIEISGHTDNQGSDAHNLDLSSRRAKAVVTYLIKNGITADRLLSKGFGKNKPVDTNDTPEGRQNNRRTEFVIL